MKVLLIKPPFNRTSVGQRDHFVTEPLELELVAAGIPHHDVEILDMRLDTRLDQTIERYQPDIVGVTAYTTDVYRVRGVLRRVKELDRKIVTVVGGIHATVSPEDFNQEYVDIIVIGEGIYPFRELVDNLERGKSIHGIHGTACRDSDGRLFIAPPRPPIQSSEIPMPRHNLTVRYRNQYFMGPFKPTGAVRTAWGCPYRCNFCVIWIVHRGRYVARSPESVVDEIKSLAEEYIYFSDDNTLHDVARVERLAQLLKERKIKKQYQMFTRSDFVCEHPKLIEQLVEVGLRAVGIGIEAISDDELRFLNKKTSVNQNTRALEILRDNGIAVQASFILSPDFMPDDFARLAEYVDRMDIGFPSFTVLTPLPGTVLYKQKYNEIIVHNYEMYDLNHAVVPTKLPIAQFHAEWVKLYIKSYSPLRIYQTAKHCRLPLRAAIPGLGLFVRFMYSLLRAPKDYPAAMQTPDAPIR